MKIESGKIESGNRKISQIIGTILFLWILAIAAPLSAVGSLPDGLTASSSSLLKTIDNVFFSATGRLTLSVDGGGSLETAYSVAVEKPNESATVRSAFLMAASTGGSSHVIGDQEILLGSGRNLDPVVWNNMLGTRIASSNHLADVTAIVRPIVNRRAAGRITLTVNETQSDLVDGVALAVIFDDPERGEDITITLLFGAQNPDGDSFSINLAEPLDPDAPDATLDMGLGISFGAQAPCARGIQFSTIDVNGQRLTSAAGGEDDGVCADGALITVGGLDDSNANPANPNAGPGGNPRTDDELYSLLPFLTPTTTQVSVDTENPSDDDNIFFAYFVISGEADVTPSTCSPNSTTLCLDDRPGDRRFRITLNYESVLGGGIMGDAVATPLAAVGIPKGGMFSFTDPANPEVLVKVLNGCTITDHFWVFYAAATTVGFELKIEDTKARTSRTYTNPDLRRADAVADTRAFATCDF